MTYVLSGDEVVLGATVHHRVVGTQVVLDAPGAVKHAGGAPVAAVTQGETCSRYLSLQNVRKFSPTDLYSTVHYCSGIKFKHQ